MTKDQKLEMLYARAKTLEGRGDKNIKSGGVLRKLHNTIRKVEASDRNEY